MTHTTTPHTATMPAPTSAEVCAADKDALLRGIIESFSRGELRNQHDLTLNEVENILQVPKPYPAGQLPPQSGVEWDAEMLRAFKCRPKKTLSR